MTVEIVDIDLDIGENNEITFKIENSTFSTAFNLEHAGGSSKTALITILPRDEDVGTNFLNLSVHDGKGDSDFVMIEIETINVNDAPEIPIILNPSGKNNTNIFSVVDTIKFEGSADDEDFYIQNSQEVLTYIWRLEYTDGSDKTLELNRGTTTNTEPFNFKMVPIDFHLQNDPYNVRLLVRDEEKVERSVEVTITLSDDYDADLILDKWEKEYGLNPHNRKDAKDDFDDDGYNNLEEFEAGTNPYDKRDHPKDSSSEANYNWALILLAVVIVIVLIVLFLFVQKKRTAKVEDDIDQLAYPAEEGFEMELAKPMGAGAAGTADPGAGVGMGAGPMGMQPQAQTGTGMPGQSPGQGQGMQGMPNQQQFMNMNPMQRMQLMQQMQMQMQMRQQQQQQQQGQGGQGQGPGAGMGTGAESGAGMGAGMGMYQMQTPSDTQTSEKLQSGKVVESGSEQQLEPVGLKPQLPPGRPSEIDGDMPDSGLVEPDGRHAPLDSVTDEELGELDIEDHDPSTDSELTDTGNLDQEQAADPGTDEGQNGNGNDVEDGGEEMKCPNCGISVKSGWFLCPACKSPIN
jgi:hypothetical protein